MTTQTKDDAEPKEAMGGKRGRLAGKRGRTASSSDRPAGVLLSERALSRLINHQARIASFLERAGERLWTEIEGSVSTSTVDQYVSRHNRIFRLQEETGDWFEYLVARRQEIEPRPKRGRLRSKTPSAETSYDDVE